MIQSRIPATIVTGFLGAGKTTLIRNLIADAGGRRIAVIVNEFGDMGFDGRLLADCNDADCRPESIVELTNGCICCTVADEFLPTMEALLLRDPPPDHIVVETSGLALPQPLVRAFAWPSVRHRVTVDAVVTVVDAVAVAAGRFAPDVAAAAGDAARDHDDPIEELFEDQLRCADLVVISKADLVTSDTIAGIEGVVRRQARPKTPTVRGSTAGLPAAALLGLSAAAEFDMVDRGSHHDLAGDDHDHDDFASIAIPVAPFPSLDSLRRRVVAVLALPGVLRVKGFVRIDGKIAVAVVQGVGARLETYFDPSAKGDGLVVIGLRGFDEAAAAAQLSAS